MSSLSGILNLRCKLNEDDLKRKHHIKVIDLLQNQFKQNFLDENRQIQCSNSLLGDHFK